MGQAAPQEDNKSKPVRAIKILDSARLIENPNKDKEKL
jgi:hypothetical protein